MHVTVFGATGRIGRLVVAQLLNSGHEVTAPVRSPSKLTITDAELSVIVAELTDTEAAYRAVEKADAVISALGPSMDPRDRSTQLSRGTRTILTAMAGAGVRRYVGLATPTVPDPRDRPNLRAKLLPLIAGTAFPNALREIRGMSADVATSGLDWTIARITNPTDRPAKHRVRAGFLGRDAVGWAMTRPDIAAFLVSQLEDTRYLAAAPAISN